jgi:hypothetical protein
MHHVCKVSVEKVHSVFRLFCTFECLCCVLGFMVNYSSGVPRIFSAGGGGGLYQEFFRRGGSTNSVEDRGQRERGSGGGSPLVRGSTQFANE